MAAIKTFLAMGGFAEYVWPAYGVALVVLGGIAVQSWWRYRTSRRTLETLQREAEERR